MNSGRIVFVVNNLSFFLGLNTRIMQVIAGLWADCAADGGVVTVLRSGGKEEEVAEADFEGLLGVRE